MKEVKFKEGKRKEAVEKIFKDISVNEKIGEAQNLGGNGERGTEMEI